MATTLDSITADFCYMKTLRSDNGPPFKSHEFAIYCKNSGIKNQRITPLWPRANGMVERFMKPLTKAIRVEGKFRKNFNKEIQDFTRAYNATPHTSTGLPPRNFIFKSSVSSTKLPVLNFKPSYDNLYQILRENDRAAKETSKYYADQKLGNHHHHFKIGQEVLLKQIQKRKTVSILEPAPYTISDKKGNMVLVSKDGKTYARNISLIQPFFSATESFPRTKTNVGAKVLKTPCLTFFSLSRFFLVVQRTGNTSVVALVQTDLISFDDAGITQGNDTELNVTTEEHR